MAARVLAVVLFCVGWAGPAAAGDTMVLLDRSGSMTPYYTSGLVHGLGQRIVDACGAADADVGAFDVSWEKIDRVGVAQVTNRDTNLSRVLREVVPKYRRVWILTDNVQDVGGSHDMSEFYAALRSEGVRHVYVFPLRQQPGSAGLLIYALSRDEEPAQLQRQVAEFRSRPPQLSTSELLMKPLGTNSIAVQAPDAATITFREGERLTVEATVRISARYPHLYFESSPARGIDARSPFVGESCLVSEKGEAHIDPSFVQTASAGEYHIRVDFGRVRLRRSLGCLWTAAFRRSAETTSVEAATVIDVSKASLKLSRAFLTEFAATTPEEAAKTGRIFGVQHVPTFLAPDSTEIPIHIPVKVIVRYPAWPAVLLIGVAMLLLAGLWVAVRSIDVASWGKPKVIARTPDGELLRADLRNGHVYVTDSYAGRIEGDRFVAADGVRLTSGDPSAPITSPVDCVLSDDSPVVLHFGGVEPKDSTGGSGSEPVILERR